MLGNRSLWRPSSGTLDTLILEDGMNDNIKREAMKRMIQGLQLPMAQMAARAPEREYGIECNPF